MKVEVQKEIKSVTINYADGTTQEEENAFIAYSDARYVSMRFTTEDEELANGILNAISAMLQNCN